MRRGVTWLLSCGCMAVMAIGAPGVAQAPQNEAVARGPRFLLATKTLGVPVSVDIERSPLLNRRISVDLRGMSLERALETITSQAGLKLSYSRTLIPIGKTVRLAADEITVAGAISAVLVDVPVDVLFTASGQAALVPRAETSAPVSVAGTITGRVVDGTSGQPVGRTQLLVLGTSTGAVADDEGRYTIPGVPAGRREVAARRVGYAPATTTVTVIEGGSVTLDFRLTRLATSLDAIVTTVTGEQRSREIGNVIGRIAADSVALNAPVMSFTDLLNGRIAGVQVLSSPGSVGATPRIRIRGLNSATVPNDPIVILDGVRYDVSFNAAGGLAPSEDFGRLHSQVADINPEEIESVQVVKGPAAATLYGTDAANGVLLIRTKRGAVGRARWSFTGEQDLSTTTAKFPDNYYSWGHNLVGGAQVQCTLVLMSLRTCAQDSLSRVNPLEEKATTPFGIGYRDQAGLQVAGGTPQLGYFVSGAMDRDVGVFKMPDAEVARVSAQRGSAVPYEQVRPNVVEKATLRGNISARFAGNGDVTLALGVVRNDTRLPGVNNTPIASAWYGTGYRGSPSYFYSDFGGAPGNAFAVVMNQLGRHTTPSVTARWQPTSWLLTRGTLGADLTSEFFDAVVQKDQGVGIWASGRRLNQRTTVENYSGDLGATATFQVTPSISSNTGIGTQYVRRSFGQTTIEGVGLVTGSQTSVGATTLYYGEQNVSTVVAGEYVEQTLGFRERLFVTGALRADGATAFGANFHTSVYPKASVSWVLSDESFLNRFSRWLGDLRLRAAYGTSGVQPAPTAALVLATPVASAADGGLQNGATFTALGNANLKPERQTEFETGLDAGLFKRAHVEATYYRRTSTDALMNTPLAWSVGYASRQQNIGSIRNEGIEGEVNVRLLEGGRTGLELGFNGSVNRNRVLQLPPGVTQLANGSGISRVGYPVFAAWSRMLVSYADANGDGIITPSEVTVTDTAVYVGPGTPSRQVSTFGTLSLFGGSVRISTLFDYRGDVFVRRQSDLTRCTSFANCREVNDKTTPLAEQANIVARTIIGGAYQNPYHADFTRWKELSAQITLPARFAARVGARQATVIVGGRNLALFTSYPGVDPEMVGNPNDVPTSFPTIPPVRTWLVRVNLGY